MPEFFTMAVIFIIVPVEIDSFGLVRISSTMRSPPCIIGMA